MEVRRVTSLALLLVLDALLLSGVTATLSIYENRLGIKNGIPFFETYAVEGVATVELGGSAGISFSMDCNATNGSGEGITWFREQGTHNFNIQDIANGKRLSLVGIEYVDLDVYLCRDSATGDEMSINITSSNPAVCPVDNSVGVVEGGSVELAAYVSGIPPILSQDIHWYDPAGVEITTGATFQTGRRRMILSNVLASSTGMYRCQARLRDLFPAPSTSAYIHLEVYVPPAVTKHPTNMTTAEEWMGVTLTCSATGNPLPTFTWEREGGELSIKAQKNRVVNGNTATSTLTIEPVRYADAGRYRCIADNSKTAIAYSEYGEIVVTPALQLEAEIDGVEYLFVDLVSIQPGSSLIVECAGSGDIEWRSSSDGQTISTNNVSPVYQISDPSRNVQALQISSFTEELTAMYTCITNLTYIQVRETILITSSNPAVFIAMEIQYVLPGTSTDIIATVYSHPALDEILWYHEGILVDPNVESRFSFTDGEKRSLHIEGIEEELFGRYEVVARIDNLTASDDIVIAIPARPTVMVAPAIQSVNIGDKVTFQCEAAGDGEIVVEWRLKDGEDLPEGAEQERNDLVISSVDTSFAGTYACFVSNLAGTDNATAELNVFFQPTATITYGSIATTTNNPTIVLDFLDGDQGPTFSCSANGYFPPQVTWTFKGSEDLPAGVKVFEMEEDGRIVEELVWERLLEYSDSGQFKCTAFNSNGTSSAALNISVIRDPKINSIFPTDPVTSEPTSSASYAIPGGHTGVALTCTAFAWPKPTIKWVIAGGNDLPEGIVSEGNAESGTDTSTVFARLRWNRGFTESDEGEYTCVVSWDNYDDLDNSDSQTVQIVKTSEVVSSPTPQPACTISSAIVEFQLRVLTDSCTEWDPLLLQHIREDFNKELIIIISSNCNCTVQPSSILIDSLTCSEKKDGAVVFEGTITTDSISESEQIYCSLMSWYESSPTVLVMEDLHTVDTTCQLELDKDSEEECARSPSSTADDPAGIDIMIIIYIVAPAVLAVVVLVVLICCVCCWSKKMRSKRDLNKRETWPTSQTAPKDQPNLQRVYRNPSPTSNDHELTGSSGTIRAPRAQQLRTSPPAEDTVEFQESPYQRPHRPHSNPSPEHVPMRTLSRDRLIESTDSGSSPTATNFASPGTSGPQLDAHPYQLPVSSVGRIDRVGLQQPVQRQATPPMTGVANPLSFLESDEFVRRPSQESALSARRQSHDGYRSGGGVSSVPAPRRSSQPTSSTLPPGITAKQYVNLPVLNERADSPGPPSSIPRSHRSPISTNRPRTGASSSSSSAVKLATTSFSPSRESGMSEDLPPYSSRPPSLLNGRPWYETESDFSIDRSSRRSDYVSDVQPYATIHNSAIPLMDSRSSIASRPRLPPGRPPTSTGAATMATNHLPQPYATPIRGSVDTLSNVQGNSNFQMVTV